MPALSAVAMFLQDNGSVASDIHSILIAQWIMAAFCILLILILLVAGIALLTVIRGVQKKVKELEAKADPLIGQGRQIAANVGEIVADLKPKIAAISSDLQPKIKSISSDVTHISNLVRNKVDEAGQTFSQVNSTVQDVNTKSKAQVQRVNGMVSDALTTTEHVSRSIQHGIRVPVQKVTEWVAAAKSGIETLSERIPFLHHVTPPMRSGAGWGASGRPSSGSPSGPGPVPVRPASTGSSGLSTPAGPGAVRPTTTTTSATGPVSAPVSGPLPGSGSGPVGGPGSMAGARASGTGPGGVRETGTAAPGGPPFVPAPDKPKR